MPNRRQPGRTEMPARVRHIGRRLLARGLPAPLHPQRTIAVVGLPRSGTSWLAKCLALAPGVSYYFEPDVVLDERYMYRYQPAEGDDPELLQHLRRQLGGRIVDDYVIAEQSLAELLARPLAHSVLVKWVRLGLMLEWLARHFPELVVVQLVRHPVPLFLSWRQRGWDPAFNLDLLLRQQVLMEGPLQPWQGVMRSARGYWEQAGAFWGAMVVMQYRAHRPGWFFHEHEWFCLDAEARIGDLAGRLGLEWTPAMSEFLSPGRRRRSGPGYGAPRDPRSEVYKWQGAVATGELAALQAVLREFELPFYPDLAPDRFVQLA
ncbi:sulfotransferase [Thiohalobacter sp. IOR34]|uniref:sulfotransferase n=1 Tax=Thiohalobacter sp. IOR34 TaxID=3057176 RepID=UPI0025B201B7|nr:sulfotransferase [Thiohalobacter sp. IOR34]WJW74449.1 sulfotransferase [Thiohalobacter sp. IOR34]